MDIFQERYLKHQERKKKLFSNMISEHKTSNYTEKDFQKLLNIMINRRSRRIFSGNVLNEEVKVIKAAAKLAPSSCNRKAVDIVESKVGIETLVGGKMWIEKADRVLMFYANMSAYKSPNEVDFMPYLDTGFMAQNVYLICEVMGLKCCFVNPNHTGKEIERDGYRFCGAMAIGR